MRIDNHVVLSAEIPLAELLVGEVGVGNFIGVERGADPAFVLRALPGVDVANARDVEVVRWHVRHGGHRNAREAERREHRTDRCGVGIRDDEGTGAELLVADFEVLLSRAHRHVLQAVAHRHEVVVRGVIHHDDAAASGDAAGSLRRPGELRHPAREDA